MNVNDAIGARGEALFYALITEFHTFGRGERPLFAAAYLGEKWETVDFIVELVGTSGVRPFFFVQVKTTRRGYSADNTRLNVKVKREDVRRLNLYSIPTYIVGVNDFDKAAYIVSANGETLNPLSSMSVDCPINAVNRQALWNEVFAFWTASALPKLTSSFVDAEWR